MRRRSRAPLLAPLLVMLATFGVFAPLIGNDFTWWDDPLTIHHNPRLNPPTPEGLWWYWANPDRIMGLYIPVTNTAWWLLARIAYLDQPDPDGIRLNPYVFHAASVTAHVASALVAYLLIRRLARQRWAAALGAMAFAVHPVQVESVAWASGLKDVLCGLFTLLALHQYVAFVQARQRDVDAGNRAHGRGHYALCLLAALAAMLAKPTGVVVPLLALAVDWLLLRRPIVPVLRATVPLVLLALPVIAVTRRVQETIPEIAAPLWSRPLIALDALAFYLYKLVWPLDLAVDYGRRPAVVIEHGWLYWTWVAPAAVAIALGIAWLVGRRAWPWLATAAAVFVLGVAPVSGILPFHFQAYSTVADHYLYIPMLGVGLAVAWAVMRWPRTAGGVAVAVLVALGVRSMHQARYWQDDGTLFARVLEVNPRSFVAYNALGSNELAQADRLAAQGEAAAAREAYERAVAYYRQAIAVNPQYASAYETMGYVLAAKLNRLDEGMAALAQALDIRTEHPWSHSPGELKQLYLLMGQVLENRGDLAGAADVYRRLYALEPSAEARRAFEGVRERLTAGSATTAPAEE